MDGRGIECARGKVIGGSSSINAMAYVRGNRGDYDRWAAAGLTGWSYAHVLPYFRRQECWQGGPSYYRGGDGPLSTQMRASTIRWSRPSRRPAATPAIPATPDYNGARQEGFGVWQMTVRDGRRCSAARRLSAAGAGAAQSAGRDRRADEPRRHRGQPRGRRRICPRAAETMMARASSRGGAVRRRHQLAAGADAVGHRRSRRVARRTASRSRWRCAASARICRTTSRRASPTSARSPARCTGRCGSTASCAALAEAHFRGTGIATELPAGIMAFLKTAAGRGAARHAAAVQRRADDGDAVSLRRSSAAYADGYACRAAVLRPQSRGEVELASADPTRGAAHPAELPARPSPIWKMLRAGLRIAREVMPAAGDGAVHGRARSRPVQCRRRCRDRRPYPRERHHRPSPARHLQDGLASDDMAVVDGELRVHGVDGLRVVDGSVMPGPGRRQHQRADHHDRRKGSGLHPRPEPPLRSRRRVACSGDRIAES